MNGEKLAAALLKRESVLLPLDFKRIAIVGTLLLPIIMSIAPHILEFVALPEISADSAVRGGLLYVLLTVVIACLYVLYQRHRAYYSTTERFLARALTVAATGLCLPLLWRGWVSLAPAVANYWGLANVLSGLVLGGGAMWVGVVLLRDLAEPSEHVFLVCEFGEEAKKGSEGSTYLARVIIDGLKSALPGEEHRIRVEYLDEVVLDERRARQLGANARAAVVAHGYFRQNAAQPASALLFAKFAVLRAPRFYPGVLALKQGALVDLGGFGLETGLTNGTVCLSCFLIGLFYYWEKRYEAALRQFTAAQEVLPPAITSLGLQEIMLYRGNALCRLERYVEAIAAYTEAISMDSSFARAYNNLGVCHGQLGKASLGQGDSAAAQDAFKEATNEFSQATALDADLTVAHQNNARVCGQLGLFKEAVDHYTAVIRSRPKDPDLYLYRAEARAKSGAYDQAISDLSHVIRLSPNNMVARLNLAGCYHHLQRYGEAIKEYTRVTKLVPSSADAAKAYRKVGDIYSITDEFEEAVNNYTKALKLDPDNPTIYVNRGNKMLLLGRFRHAASDFAQAISLDPDLPEPYAGLGTAQIYLGELEEGVANLSKALALDPDYESARVSLDRVQRLPAALSDEGQLPD